MRIDFPYPDVPPVDVPDERLLAVAGPRAEKPSALPEALVRDALACPIGGPRLRDRVDGDSGILIVVDDNTRPTPAALVLPLLLEELRCGGATDPNISFLVAGGTHRPMTAAEKIEKLGDAICSRYSVNDHLWDDPAELVVVGHADSGVRIEINRRVKDADVVIGLGQVVPHRVAGFSGGSKIIHPGTCGAAGTGDTHWKAAMLPGNEILGRRDNPVRAEIDRVGALAGLTAIVNLVLTPKNDIAGCYVGDPVEAHRAACEQALRVFRVPIPAEADIVLIESYPADLDIWQASKALAAAELAVRPGGVVILVTPSPEGVSGSHPAVLEIGYCRPDEVCDRVRKGELADMVVAAELAMTGRVVSERARAIVVSPYLSAEDTRRLHMEPAPTPADALDRAFELTGPEAKVIVLRHGGDILPIVEP